MFNQRQKTKDNRSYLQCHMSRPDFYKYIGRVIFSKGGRQKADGKCKIESESEKCTVCSQQDATETTVRFRL